MKWYNQNGLKILYDAEYSGDYLINRKFGLEFGSSDQIRGNSYIDVNTSNSLNPNARIKCKTLEVFVTFEAQEFDGGTGNHRLFDSSGDMDDSDQVGTTGDWGYQWYLKSEEYSSQYIFSNYPLIIFRYSNSEDFFDIVMGFMKVSSSQSEPQNNPSLWIRIPVTNIYSNDSCNEFEDAFQLGGKWDSGNFIGRLSSAEAEGYSDLPYYKDFSSNYEASVSSHFPDDMDYCDFDMETDTYALRNRPYPVFPEDTPPVFRGMTITITSEQVTDEQYETPATKITFYCNGRKVYTRSISDSNSQETGEEGFITLPPFISNQTDSERYGYWQYDDNKDYKLCQPLFVRAYDRTLSLQEIQNNTDVDHQRFVGDMDMGWVSSTPPPEGFPQDSGGSGDLDW